MDDTTIIVWVLIAASVALALAHFEIGRQYKRQQARVRAQQEQEHERLLSPTGRIQLATEIVEYNGIVGHVDIIFHGLNRDIDVEVREDIAHGDPRRVIFTNVQRDCASDMRETLSFEYEGNKFEIERSDVRVIFNEQLVLEMSNDDDVEAFVDGEWIERLFEARSGLEAVMAELNRHEDAEEARQEQEDLERRASRIVLRPLDPGKGE